MSVNRLRLLLIIAMLRFYFYILVVTQFFNFGPTNAFLLSSSCEETFSTTSSYCFMCSAKVQYFISLVVSLFLWFPINLSASSLFTSKPIVFSKDTNIIYRCRFCVKLLKSLARTHFYHILPARIQHPKENLSLGFAYYPQTMKGIKIVFPEVFGGLVLCLRSRSKKLCKSVFV